MLIKLIIINGDLSNDIKTAKQQKITKAYTKLTLLNFFVLINKNNINGHKSFAIKDPATFSSKKIPENLSKLSSSVQNA